MKKKCCTAFVPTSNMLELFNSNIYNSNDRIPTAGSSTSTTGDPSSANDINDNDDLERVLDLISQTE